MCKIKCPHFIHNSHKLRNKIVDKKSRKIHLIRFCCGNHAVCNLCKED
jgi:hypothetical protein